MRSSVSIICYWIFLRYVSMRCVSDTCVLGLKLTSWTWLSSASMLGSRRKIWSSTFVIISVLDLVSTYNVTYTSGHVGIWTLREALEIIVPKLSTDRTLDRETLRKRMRVFFTLRTSFSFKRFWWRIWKEMWSIPCWKMNSLIPIRKSIDAFVLIETFYSQLQLSITIFLLVEVREK